VFLSLPPLRRAGMPNMVFRNSGTTGIPACGSVTAIKLRKISCDEAVLESRSLSLSKGEGVKHGGRSRQNLRFLRQAQGTEILPPPPLNLMPVMRERAGTRKKPTAQNPLVASPIRCKSRAQWLVPWRRNRRPPCRWRNTREPAGGLPRRSSSA